MTFNKTTSPIDLLLTRRSAKAKLMQEPGPDADQLRTILEAGMRVPDHGKLAPFRFHVFQGEAQEKFGELIMDCYEKEEQQKTDAALNKLINFPQQAPVMIAVTSVLNHDRPIPEIEQRLTAGAACQNIMLAATALGFGVNWLTGWSAFSKGVKEALEVGPNDHIAAFIFIGSQDQAMTERPRPNFDDIVTYWD